MLLRPKDPVPVEERKGFLYSIPCIECSSMYIGQTGSILKQHVSEYRCALNNGNILYDDDRKDLARLPLRCHST